MAEENPFKTLVKVKYVPVADNYKQAPLVASVTGDHDGQGYQVRATLHPGEEKKVPVCIARELRKQVEKFNRNKQMVNVPDGRGMENRMLTDAYDENDGGVMSKRRQEYESPDYELVVYGDI